MVAQEKEEGICVCVVLLQKHSPRKLTCPDLSLLLHLFPAFSLVLHESGPSLLFCDTPKSVKESLNHPCVSTTVLCCPSQCRNSVLFYFLHFLVTTAQVFAAMCTGWCWQQHCGRVGSPVLGAVQTRVQSWFSPCGANEDDLYKICIYAEKHWGFDFISFILPLDRLMYKAFGDWRCTALFCALQYHLCFYCYLSS